jgi:hypothetical protein
MSLVYVQINSGSTTIATISKTLTSEYGRIYFDSQIVRYLTSKSKIEREKVFDSEIVRYCDLKTPLIHHRPAGNIENQPYYHHNCD